MKSEMNPKSKAVDKAIVYYEEIVTACTRPDKSISGETLSLYKELVDWGFTDKYDITNLSNKWLYVVLIAMDLIRKEEFPSLNTVTKSEEKGKWEIIQLALERAVNAKEEVIKEKENKHSKKRA